MGRTKRDASGPFRVSDLSPGDRYELSEGHAFYMAPGGGDHARATSAGAQALGTDPAVESSGIDAGFTAGDDATLRAPDLAIGGVPDKPGWIKGVPPLAVEYASGGQDEDSLQDKISELLRAGTKWIWVVRLVGPRRVEVYEADQPVRVVGPGAMLSAPGVLANEVRVEALYDPAAAQEAALRNLLQRQGYASLDEVRREGREEGREEGVLGALRSTLRDLLAARPARPTDPSPSAIDACADSTQLRAWILDSVR